MLVQDLIFFGARHDADAIALIAADQEWSFAQFAEAVDSMSGALMQLARPGATVAVVAENTPGFAAALYAVPAAEMVLAMGNTRHTDHELWEMLAASRAEVVLATRTHLDRLIESKPDDSLIHTWVELSPEGPEAMFDSAVTFDAAVPSDAGGRSPDSDAPGARPRGRSAESDTAWLIYTSGTTGKPKGAMITHRSLIAAALNTTMARPVAADEVYLFPFPLFHVAAYNVVHHHLRRRPVVLLPSFEPAAAMRAIEEHSVTSVSLAPTMVAMLLDHPDRADHDLSTLRQISYGAAAMPLDLLRRALSELPSVGLAQGYGMTELSGNAVFLGPEEHRRAATTDPGILSAAGRPAPLTALRITAEDDSEVPPGEVGEILIRSDQVCAGYWDNPEATAEAFFDGWFRTGDVGRLDARGYLHIVDRKKDIIITGGENVSSREVEDAVSTHPSVASVAVIGVPDERWGELVTAVIVVADGHDVPGAEDLKSWTSDLAGFKRPKGVVEVDQLPLNASGKVEKRRLRDDLIP